MKGYVYILANPAFPQLVRIGKTIDDPEARAKELSSVPGMPGCYTVQWQALVTDCSEVERLIHDRLARERAHNDREFFVLPLNEAILVATNIAAHHEAKRPARRGRMALVCAAILLLGGALWLRSLAQRWYPEPGEEREAESRPTTQGTVTPPAEKAVPTPVQWQLDPTPLLVGQAATVVLRNGSTVSGGLHAAAKEEISLTVGPEVRCYRAQEIAQVIQLAPAFLDDAEKQACLAQITVAFKGVKSPKQDERLGCATITNGSKYHFRGRIRLTSLASDGAQTGEAELCLGRGQQLGPRESATHEVAFHTSRWVAEVRRSVEGEFYRKVADVRPVRVEMAPEKASP